MSTDADPPDYSLKEAAALAGLSERTVRNEITRGVIRPTARPRGRRGALGFSQQALLYLMLVADLPIPLSRADRRDLFRLIAGRRKAGGSWRLSRGVARKGIVAIDTVALGRRLAARTRLYRRGRRRIVSDAAILGGEPVFTGTRISVRHIGRLAARGVPADELRADYPALSTADIAFARLFAGMKRDPGRPRRRLRFRRSGD
jgi:uncharacterized protein (DUF433 family)